MPARLITSALSDLHFLWQDQLCGTVEAGGVCVGENSYAGGATI
jgi:hypothetical protein